MPGFTPFLSFPFLNLFRFLKEFFRILQLYSNYSKLLARFLRSSRFKNFVGEKEYLAEISRRINFDKTLRLKFILLLDRAKQRKGSEREKRFFESVVKKEKFRKL